MKPLDPKDRASFDRIAEVIARIAPDWRSQPNVIDIVPALKTRAGYVQPDVLAIGFHVTEKVTPELLADRGFKPIPNEIEGIPTDVILARQRALGSVDTKNTRSQMFDTLVGGIAVGNANMNAYGTLGMTLLAVSDSRMVGITNEHVLVFDGDGHLGDEVQQPRFYLNSEVSLDSASCCPDGQLHYRGVDNPIVDAAVAVFAAAALAAALSDTIDPHRRGQDATTPAPDERTKREAVSVALDYPEIPFPGRPYKLGVQWTYQRQTDRQVMEHSVTETTQNEHLVGVQHLITDKRRYVRGEKVTFLAILGAEPGQRACNNYFVTAAALSPSHKRAYKIILRPYEFIGGADARRTHGDLTHGLENDVVRQCHDFSSERPGNKLQQPRTIDNIDYDPRGQTALFVQPTRGDPISLQFPDQGLVASFHLPVQRVIAEVIVPRGLKVTMTAYSGTTAVGSAVSTTSGPVSLDVASSSISRVVLEGGRHEALLRRLCIVSSLGHFCLYRGEVQLAPNEELGQWKTYVFAQTRNDVPLGTEPGVAARTIGGLPVTNNFGDAGTSDNITYGHQCNVSLVPDGDFEVVAEVPEIIA